MKTTALKIFTGLALLALAPTAALAHGHVSVNIGLGGGYYYAPEPVYAEPAPVYYETRPSYYYGQTEVYAYRHPHCRDSYREERFETHRWHDQDRYEHRRDDWHHDDDE